MASFCLSVDELRKDKTKLWVVVSKVFWSLDRNDPTSKSQTTGSCHRDWKSAREQRQGECLIQNIGTYIQIYFVHSGAGLGSSSIPRLAQPSSRVCELRRRRPPSHASWSPSAESDSWESSHLHLLTPTRPRCRAFRSLVNERRWLLSIAGAICRLIIWPASRSRARPG